MHEPRMTDLVTVAQAVAAYLGIKAGADLSAYSVLILAAVAGATWALIGEAPSSDTRMRARVVRGVVFVLGRVVLTVLIGATAVNIIVSTTGVDARHLIAPVGAFVAAVGWRWIIERVRGWLPAKGVQ